MTSVQNPVWRDCVLLSQQWIRIDVDAVPELFGIRDLRDREMQMVVSRTGVSGIANIGDGFPLFGEMPFGQTIGISIEVRVIIDELAVHAQLINGRAAARALE